MDENDVMVPGTDATHPHSCRMMSTMVADPRFAVRYTPRDRSYAIELSPDKRIATVRARGDLDGDGKLALHEISVRIDFKGKVTIDPEIRVEHELE